MRQAHAASTRDCCKCLDERPNFAKCFEKSVRYSPVDSAHARRRAGTCRLLRLRLELWRTRRCVAQRLAGSKGVRLRRARRHRRKDRQPHDTASVTKSVTSTLIGIAVDQDLLSLDQPVLAFFPDLAPPTTGSDPKDAIEMRHLLTMSSGLDCGRAPGEPELYQMLGSEHFVKYALELPMAAEPGEYFAYCSPGSHLLSAMVTKAADTSTGAFAAEHLFGPLGIEEFVWPTDPQGIERGWGDLQLFPHDMARIGHLVANGGLWNGVQVVSESWVEQATRSWIPAEVDGTGYGYQWWILAGAFDGLYEARGRGGQAIIIWPDKDIVVVFTGRGVDVRGEIALLLADALKSDEAIEPNPAAEARLQAALAQARPPPCAGADPCIASGRGGGLRECIPTRAEPVRYPLCVAVFRVGVGRHVRAQRRRGHVRSSGRNGRSAAFLGERPHRNARRRHGRVVVAARIRAALRRGRRAQSSTHRGRLRR